MGNGLPEMGKISAEAFEEVIAGRLGKKRPEVVVGPENGVDVGVVDLGGGQVMVTTTDPVFVVPQYGWERAAWFAVHILASDAVTSGLPPRYITVDLNLPLSMEREELAALWKSFHQTCEEIGMAVVSGHTGRYDGCNYPMVGGATVICIGPEDAYLTPKMARVGDEIIVTKGAAVEAAGLFAVTFPHRVAAAYGEEFAGEAEEIFWQMSVVKDALTAVQVGVRDEGVTSLHDATEGGVWGGLYEVARASGVGMLVEKEDILVQEAVRKVCELFEIDPYASISEGTLIITCRPDASREVLDRLVGEGIPAGVVGEVVEAEAGIRYIDDGRPRDLRPPAADPFWAAFARAAEGA